MLFDGWAGLVRTVVVGVPAYVFLIALLRLSGKRTLSKMNAFDFVVTVALGSTLATILLSRDVALAEGVAALRNQGLSTLDEAHAVVLETDGTFSVVRAEPRSSRSALGNVAGL